MPSGLSSIGSQLYSISQISSLQDQTHLPSSDLLRLGGGTCHFDQLLSSNPPPFRPPQASSSSSFFLGGSNQHFPDSSQNKPFHGLMQLPDLHGGANESQSPIAANSSLFNLGFFSNGGTNGSNSNGNLLFSEQFNGAGVGDSATLFSGNLMGNQIDFPSVQQEQAIPHLSATALLQKAAQMGSTTSGNASPLLRGFGSSSSSSSVKQQSFKHSFNGGGETIRTHAENETHIQNLMNSFASGAGSHIQNPNGGFSGFNPSFGSLQESKLQDNLSMGSIGGSDGMTRDFLGVGSVVRSMAGGISSQRDQRHGLDIAPLDSDFKSASASRSYPGGNL